MEKTDRQTEFQRFLRERFEDMRLVHPSLSLRAFARRLTLSPGVVSLILNGKRTVSRDTAAKVARALMLSPEETQNLIQGLGDGNRASTRGHTKGEPLQYAQLAADEFCMISDWEHFGILSLLRTRGFNPDPEWIATRLDLPLSRIKRALERMLKMGLIVRTASGGLRRTRKRFQTTDEIASISVKRNHEQCFELVRQSLHRDPVGMRDMTAITMAIDPDRLPKAKEMIRAFQDQLSEWLEGGKPREVYRLSMQLFPMTRLNSERRGSR